MKKFRIRGFLKFRFLTLIVPFLTLALTPALAKIIHVPADSSSIQSGINGASDGDTVLVARGHYYERINFLGKGILVASNFIFDSLQLTIYSTIIDADTLVLGVSDTNSVVVFVSGEDSTATLQGFTLCHGIGIINGLDRQYGGGIYIDASSPTITNNLITENNAYISRYKGGNGGGIFCGRSVSVIANNFIYGNNSSFGGGICCWKASPTISNNYITVNSSSMGGGISLNSSSPVISNNTISENSASGEGGGIHCQWWSFPVIYNNIIAGNSGGSYGGGIDCWWDCGGIISGNIIAENSAAQGAGIRCDESSPIITNNTITTNSASSCGGGISCSYQSFPTIANNIISNSINGEGICCDVSSSPKIYYNDVWNNADGNFYNCPAGIGDTTWGTNINGIPSDSFYNIIRDPLFVDSLNDFHFQENSPCIDAGDNSVASGLDLDGNPRIVDGNDDDSAVVDMGVYEYQPSVGIVGEEAPLSVIDFFLFQNYPNPFNPETNIQYYIPEPTRVKLAIYNILGQKVAVLVDEFQTAGRKSVTWDGKDNRRRTVTSGIYLYRLETAHGIESKKMLMLK